MIKRLVAFVTIAGVASFLGPGAVVAVARGSGMAQAMSANWDAAAAVCGLVAFGMLVLGWGSWLCFSVSGGFRDNNIAVGATSLVAGAGALTAAGIVLWSVLL
ncbi:hypothetical protein GCM10010329_04100 [Streptomyces spiroverticillatus]|uniref:Uncharacterized protein n=1 Tax=Streptomyces finlayi TaxID=67296 RepID=A0A919C6R3_9ACTN|nr:hypothetical protein [Streptomyces finlayi]GGZ87331.1 hypothetical protein GCM10010329_04100 [Streptomyces spiroverticillatus]GHC78580.1 hypothetical protein GCM10010334_04080 [Streptomyces finlayi]